MHRIEIHSFPRIHMTLLEMNGGLGSINGGIGFAVSKPRNIISVRDFKADRIILPEECGNEFRSYVHSVVAACRANRRLRPCEVLVKRVLPNHQGFGSFTSVGLSVAEGLMLLNNIKYASEEIIKLAGRGGTSGIGINTYFTGKFILDLGHDFRNRDSRNAFLPSSYVFSPDLPLTLARIEIPKWPLLLVLPKAKPISEGEERRFFRNICPLAEEDVAKAIRICLFGIVSSLMRGDYDQFCSGVRKLRETRWKRSEIRLHGNLVSTIIHEAESLGASAANMSSVGPLVYCFAKSNLISSIKNKLDDRFDLSYSEIVYPKNSGRGVIGSG